METDLTNRFSQPLFMFASIGMPPKSEAEYGELYQKHANDHEMEAQPQ